MGPKLTGVELYNSELKRKTKVYDVANKKLIAEFESVWAASNYTGVKCSYITQCMNKKYRSHTNRLGITITFR
jgi:hypothetical protein